MTAHDQSRPGPTPATQPPGQRRPAQACEPAGPEWRVLGMLLRREDLLLALLPGLISVMLLSVAFLPAFRILNNPETTWTGYNYQGLLNRVYQYDRAATNPRTPPATLDDLRDRVLSDIQIARQQTGAGTAEPLFAELPERERDAGVRLTDIEPLILSGRPADTEQAIRIAESLHAAANTHLNGVRRQLQTSLYFMQVTVLSAALLSGMFGTGLILRALNATRREQENREAREAQHRQALGMAAHELRRPLQALLLSTDALRGTENLRAREKILRMIEDHAAQLAIRTDLERLELMYVNIEPRPERTDLNALITRLETDRVRTRRPAAPVHVQADPNHLRQVLENLIENAQRYSDGAVLITLDPATPGSGPVLRVLDDGPGLSGDLLERVFEVGFRQPGSPHREGRGLGLPIARRYATANGAHLSLHSPDGGGLEARLTFPAAPDAVPDTAQAPA